MRTRNSIGGFVRPSVGWLVGRSVGRSVRHARVEKWENAHFRPCPSVRNWWPCIRPCSRTSRQQRRRAQPQRKWEGESLSSKILFQGLLAIHWCFQNWSVPYLFWIGCPLEKTIFLFLLCLAFPLKMTAAPQFCSFLDASTHLYKRLCPSVGRSVGPSVRNAFF